MCDKPVHEPNYVGRAIVEDIPDPARKPLHVAPHAAPAQQDDQPVRVAKVSTLGDMRADGYVFFTPALIITHGLFDRDPVIEFNRTHQTNDESDRPFHVDSEYPFFQALGKSLVQGDLVDWDHRLYGVHETHWAQLRDFIAAIAIYDPKRYHYAKIGFHNLKIVDPTALHANRVSAELPTIDIWVFFVSAYRYFAWMAPAKDPPRTFPFAQVDPPKPEIKVEAEAILGPPPAPEQINKRTNK